MLAPPPSPAQGAGLSEPLQALFAERDWFAVQQHDPALAFAELCLRERAQVARSAWGLQRMELLAFVVLHPEHWTQFDQLIAAIQKYVPAATIWTASESDIIPLNGASQPGKHVTKSPTASSREQPRPVGPFTKLPAESSLRLVGETSSSPARQAFIENGSSESIDQVDSHSSRITRQEIDMLLESDTPEAAAGGQP